MAGQGTADDFLGQPGDLDQAIDVEAGLDAHLLAHEGEVLGADVAGRAVGRGERAAAQAAIEASNLVTPRRRPA